MPMTLAEIKEILRAKVIVGDDMLDTEVTAGAASDLMSDLLTGPGKTGVLVLSGLNNIQVIRTALIAGVSAVVLVRNKEPNEDVIDHARKHELPIMSTPFSMYTASGRLLRQGLRGVDQKPSP